jgi:hypothetical protein
MEERGLSIAIKASQKAGYMIQVENVTKNLIK